MGVVRGENCTGRNCPRWEMSGEKCHGGSTVQGELSEWELFRRICPGGSCPVGRCLGGSCPITMVNID